MAQDITFDVTGAFFTLHMSLLVLSAFLTIIFVMAGIFMSKKKIWRGTFFFLTNYSIILLFTLNEKFLNRNYKAIVSLLTKRKALCDDTEKPERFMPVPVSAGCLAQQLH